MGMNGITLGRAFYTEAVRPLLPAAPHAAAFLGPGSDVLGFDDGVSRDHDWGPRCRLFVREEKDVSCFENALSALPETFAEYPVWYGRAPDGVRVRGGIGRAHLVKVHTVEGYLLENLGIVRPRSDFDWLRLPDQRLLEWTGGEVFHDEIGLRAARLQFASLPENVRLYRIAASWSAIGEEAAFVGRAGDTGDDTGSRIIAARLARRAMLLAFLLEGQYPPYMKWLGTAFRRLPVSALMAPEIDRLLHAEIWPARVEALGILWDILIDKQTSVLGIPIEKAPAPYRDAYWTRDLSHPVNAAYGRVKPPLDTLPPGLGSVNEWFDNTPAMAATHTIAEALAAFARAEER